MTLKLFLSCFAIGNTVKQPFNCLQYDTQTVLVLLLFCFVIGLLCYWKYSKGTVQLSPIWHWNCPCLVIVLFAIENTVKQPFSCSQYDTQTVLVLLLFCFVIVLICFENTVKQLFNCLQYDTQTVLVLLLFCFAIGNTVKQPFNCLQYDTQTVLVLLLICFAIGNTVKQPFNCLNLTLKLFLSCYCFVLLLEIQ